MALEEFNHFFMEAKLKAKERNKLDDSQFGIPSLRKYPLTDEKHVLQAVRFFGKAPKEHKTELARNIVKRAKELNMDWENWDVLKPYLDKPVKEAYAKELHSTPEADKICEYLCKSVKYDNASPKTWKLKSPDELTDHNKGNCHDTAWYVFKNLDAYAKHKVGKGILFFIEYKEGKKEGGQTHSVCYEKIPGGICIIECSWKGMTGTFPYNNIDEYVSVVKNNWEFTGDNDKLYATEIKNTSQIHPGMTLSEYVFVAMKNIAIVTESYSPQPDADHTSGTSDFDNDNMNEPDDCYCESDKTRYNDKGDSVPDKCPKCGSKIEVYLRGEPVYLCSNKECGKYYGTVPCNINESENLSETEMFYKAWHEEKSKDDYNLAKDIAKRIHEKYESDQQPPCGNQNCMLCTMCAEAQFRGIDVLPRPVYSPRDPVLKISGEAIVKNPIHKSIKSGFDDMLDLATEPKYARWYCHVKWKNGHGGHEFLLLNINKRLYVMDPQQGVITLNIESTYFEDVDYGESYMCRLDNCELNEELLNRMNDPSQIVQWDAKLDIPYMLKEGLLSEEEAEQYWKEHPNEASNDRHFLSYEELDRMSESKNIFTSGDFDKYADGVDLDTARGPIQESMVELPEGISMRQATKADRDYIFMVEMETLDEKYKNDPKVVEDIKEDAYASVHKTRIICHAKGDHTETIGLLQAYQKDDYWYIGEIYLQPEFRGKGIGESILKKEISEHDWLSLDVSKNNKHAIDLYLSLGFKIIDENDDGYRMDLKKSEAPTNVFTIDEYEKAKSFRSVIVGEIHNKSMIGFYNKLLSERNPEYFICEFVHEDRVLSQEDLKQKLDSATNGVFTPGIPDYQDNYVFYKLAYDHGCKLVGCDLYKTNQHDRMHDEDVEREAYMLRTLKEFENTRFVCQLGDHHLRSIPISKEFLDYCGDTKDDRGIVKDLTVDNASPIWEYFINSPNVAILREPNEFKNEINFINKPVKEEYNMSNFVRDPKVFKMFMEADEEEKGDALDVNEEDVELGIDDGSGEQNQYDPKEVESLNHLISSEAEAISDYFEAAKNTKVPVLSKLYSDIGEEERFHIEQLLYAKSTVTGEKYEPKDPKVRKEYEELLELGMDEETAMTTAVDKLSISVKEESIDDESDKKDADTEELEDLEESFNLYASMSNMTALNSYLIQESMSDKSTILRDVLDSNNQFITEAFFSEAVQNLNTKEGQKALGSKNPIVWVVNAIRGIYRLILNIVKKAKLAFQKIRLKSKAKWEWIHKHGIKGLFADGVSLYFYSDKTMKYDVNDAMIGLKLVHDTCEMVIKNAKLNLDTSKYEIDSFITGLQKYGDQLKPLPVPNIDSAIANLNGVKMYKTKLIVTDQNEATLEEEFFGFSKNKYDIMIKEGEESKNLNVSNNIYNKLNILLSAFTKCGNEVSDVANALAALNETSGSIYQTNNKLYNSCVSAMSAATKVLNQYTSAVSSDMSTIMNVNKGLYEAAKKADESNGKDMEDLNKYKADQKEAAKNAADQQNKAEKAANQGLVSMTKN